MIFAFFAATVAGFALSAGYYALVPDPRTNDATSPSSAPKVPTIVVVELCRSAAIAGLIVGIVCLAGWKTVGAGALLGLSLFTLPVILLIGSVVHEGTDRHVALLHAGDWLIKLVAMGLIVGWLS